MKYYIHTIILALTITNAFPLNTPEDLEDCINRISEDLMKSENSTLELYKKIELVKLNIHNTCVNLLREIKRFNREYKEKGYEITYEVHIESNLCSNVDVQPEFHSIDDLDMEQIMMTEDIKELRVNPDFVTTIHDLHKILLLLEDLVLQQQILNFLVRIKPEDLNSSFLYKGLEGIKTQVEPWRDALRKGFYGDKYGDKKVH